jgi:hypothetical protein
MKLDMDLLSKETAAAIKIAVYNDYTELRKEVDRWEAGVPCGPEPVCDTGKKRVLAYLSPQELANMRKQRDQLFAMWQQMIG